MFAILLIFSQVPSPPPIGDKPSVIIPSPGSVKSEAILGKTATGWRVTYKSRQFDFTGDSKAAAEAVQAAIVAMVDGETPKAMAAPAQPACGWVLVNGRLVYRCPNAK
jgi:hypothetical protein